MDEYLTTAVTRAGEVLARAMGQDLAERGYPSALNVVVEDCRAVIGSVHAVVRRTETGFAGRSPAGVLEAAARHAAPAVIASLAQALHEELR
jgi:hypothetical protein